MRTFASVDDVDENHVVFEGLILSIRLILHSRKRMNKQ